MPSSHNEPTTPSPSLYQERHFKTLIEQSADVIQLVSATGVILYTSDSVKRVLGFTPHDIQGERIVSYVHPDDLERFRRTMRKLLDHPRTTTSLEYRVLHKDGSWVWIETRAANHLKTPGVEAMVGNFRDISRRKEAEERLREREEQYRLLSELSPEAIAVHAEGKLLYVNKAGARLIGAKTSKELIGQPLMRFIHPDSVETVKARVSLMLEKRKPTPLVQEKFIRLDGEVVDVEVISIPFTYQGRLAIQVVVRDITERKLAVEALQDSEERLRFMAEAMPQKVFTAGADGTVDYFNPQWTSYTGLSMTELLRGGWMQAIHEEDLDDTASRWQHSIRTGDPFAFEMRFRRHDGTYRWHISRAQPMRDDDGEIVRWFGSNTDIHDIKVALQREHELETRTLHLTQQRTQLLALNEAKDEFIALASHQLRTPATAVKQFLGMLLGGYAGDLSPAAQNLASLANSSNERQISIINDLLEVARLDAGKIELHREKADLRHIVEQVVEEQTGLVGNRQQKIRVQVRAADTIALVDTTKFRMVLENLLTNASKYSPPNTTITISLSAAKKVVSLAVRDQGVGIRPEDREKLFKKFSRLDNPLSVSAGGSGLGLYWAKRIVDLHGGDIEVKSTQGKGTTFLVWLPQYVPRRRPKDAS